MLKAAIGGAAGIVLASPVRRLAAAAAQVASQGAGTERLADDLFVVTIPGETNVVAHIRPGGVLIVDGASAGATDALMNAIAGLPGAGPVHTIINTHWHAEQTGANELLGKAGQTIIAHENTRLWLATDVTWPWNGRRFKRAPKIAQPNKTFYTTGQLDSGVRYGYIPDAGHTDGDLYVHFPKQNVLAVGDVVSGQGWPVVDYATGGWIGGIVGALQRLQTLADAETRIVAGRGPVLGLSDVKAQYEMYATIYDRLAQLLNRGRGPTEAVAAKPTKEFDEKMGNPDEFVRRAFESLWGYLSPDA
jgi:glyoxylase-like metal-dependent hydrolase (beta-lactamase superfamily II)